jgi:hypothetical protein
VTGAALSYTICLYRFEGFSRTVFAVGMMIVAFLTVGAGRHQCGRRFAWR